MKTKNGKWWNMASCLELIGMVLLAVITIPAIIAFLRAEITDMQDEEYQRVRQETLIEELLDKVNSLEAERIAK